MTGLVLVGFCIWIDRVESSRRTDPKFRRFVGLDDCLLSFLALPIPKQRTRPTCRSTRAYLIVAASYVVEITTHTYAPVPVVDST